MTNSKTLKICGVLLLGLPLWFSVSANASVKKKDCILVVSSNSTHRFNTEHTYRFMDAVVKKTNLDADINVTLIDESKIKTCNQLDSLRTSIQNGTAGRCPKLIVLLGFYSYVFAEDFNKQWPNVPMLLVGERDFTGPKNLVVAHKPLKPNERIQLNQLRKTLNMTYMHAKMYRKETLDIMHKLMPNMKSVYYITDGCYSCLQNSYDLKQIVASNYPGMSFEQLSSDRMSTDELLLKLSEPEKGTAGSVYSSWSKWNDGSKNAVMSEYFYHTISSLGTPIFTFRNIGADNWKGTVGGYFADGQTYRAKLYENVYNILNGTAPRDIPIFRQDNERPTFNYNALVYFGLDPDDCPKGSVFYNLPEEKDGGLLQWFASNIWAAMLLGLLVIVFVVLVPMRLVISKRRERNMEKKMQDRIKGIINTMPLLYMYEEMITDSNGIIVETIFRDVNQYFVDHLFKRDECLGKKVSELFPDSMPIFLKMSNIAKQTGKAVNFQYYYPDLKRYYDIMGRPSEDGRFMEFFCMDCTELHNVQVALQSKNKKMNMALQTTDVSAWRWDLDNHTLHCQKYADDDNGEGHQQDLNLTEEQMYALMLDEDRERIQQEVNDLISGKIENIKTEYRTTFAQTKRIDWVEVRATVGARDENGRALTLVGTRQIITHRKEMEEELVQAKIKAEESNRLKSAFLANMSHEIRTPLNAIVGFSELLANADNDADRNEYAGIIENNSELLLQLVGDILDLSKIEAGTMEFVYTDFDLNKLMTDLHSLYLMHIPKDKQVALTCKLGLPHCVIHSERNRLTQLITNLVNNAIKFTTQGSINFGYELRGDKLYFSVQDTGYGIEKDKLGDVFNRFVKLNKFKQGTGLGLAICKSIVETLGGEIGVHSEIGKGSTFYFTIPYTPVAQPKKAVSEHKEMVSDATQKACILVAEDHESNYKLIKAILSKSYNLVHAWNGVEAVEMYKEHNPQLIIMDINMPEMNGYEATKEIRKLSKDVPILALTAYAYASDEEQILKSGMNAYMSKPINMQKLKAQVAVMI